jgi:Na+/proline symporter
VNLRPLDIGCFAFYMLLPIGTGVYFTHKQKRGLKSYLFADQDVHWIIVAIAVLAALFSGITYLGAPAESYYHDLGYVWAVASFFIATPITTLVFLPCFRWLNLSTAYEYLERRFDGRLRRIASGLFLTRVTLYLAMVIYAPALAIMDSEGDFRKLFANIDRYIREVVPHLGSVTTGTGVARTLSGGVTRVPQPDPGG